MSGPSLEVRRRWRRQVACWLAREGFVHLGREVDPRRKVGLAIILCGDYGSSGAYVNVRAAKEAARELVDLEAEQDRFEAWTRARGLGPENREPGAFRACKGPESCGGEGVVCADWREGDIPCSNCSGGWPGKLAREWPGDRRAPMGRALSRMGQRVLDALEGQPDACERCGAPETPDSELWRGRMLGCGWVRATDLPPRSASPRSLPWVRWARPKCLDCHGTGDNLRGDLPEVVETAQERHRKERALGRETVDGAC